jgi:hypothetical protein
MSHSHCKASSAPETYSEMTVDSAHGLLPLTLAFLFSQDLLCFAVYPGPAGRTICDPVISNDTDPPEKYRKERPEESPCGVSPYQHQERIHDEIDGQVPVERVTRRGDFTRPLTLRGFNVTRCSQVVRNKRAYIISVLHIFRCPHLTT